MDSIEQQVESVIRELNLPPDEMMKKRDKDWKKVEAFRASQENGKIAEVNKKLDQKTSELIKSLSAHLTSEESQQHALKMKKSKLSEAEQENYSQRNVEDLVCQRFTVAICHSPAFQAFCKWANSELAENVSEITKELNMLTANVAASKTSLPSSSALRSKFSNDRKSLDATPKVTEARHVRDMTPKARESQSTTPKVVESPNTTTKASGKESPANVAASKTSLPSSSALRSKFSSDSKSLDATPKVTEARHVRYMPPMVRVSQSTTPKVVESPNTTTKASGKESPEMTRGEVTATVAIAVPAILVGVPLAVAIGVVAAPIYGVFKMFTSLRKRNFKLEVGKIYKETVRNAVAGDAKILSGIVLPLLHTTCSSVATLKEIPKKTSNLFEELRGRREQEKKDIPSYKIVLQKCQAIKGAMAKFLLELNIHTYSANDLTWPEPRIPVASGSFGSVYKVTLPTKTVAALKEMQDPVTGDNSEQFLKERNNGRYDHFMS